MSSSAERISDCVKTGYFAVTVPAPVLNPDVAKPITQTVKTTELAPNKCSTDRRIVALMQPLMMTGPDTTETCDDSFIISIKAACRLLTRNQRPTFCVHAAHFVISTPWTPLQTGVTKCYAPRHS
jgi:hypothetical protein